MVLLGLVLAASTMNVARAGFTNLGPAQDYNDFVLGDFTQSGTDAGGNGPDVGMGVAVGGNFAPASGSFTVHGPIVVGGNYTNGPTTIDGSIYGYHDVTFSNSAVNGTVYAGHNVTISGGGSPSGGVQYVNQAAIPSYFSRQQVGSVPHPIDFDAAGDYLKSESLFLHSLSTTTGVSFVHNGSNFLTLSGSGSNFYDFQVTATQFRTTNGGFNINVTGVGGVTPTVVVDIVDDGTGYAFTHVTPSYSSALSRYILFNFAGSSPLEISSTGVVGSILAPNSAVHFNNGSLNGTLVAGSLSGGGESHAYRFLGNLPSPPPVVPEPSSIVLLGCGLAFGSVYALRQRRILRRE
jgi:choice-of-anchor A domain-containing protein